MPMTQFDLSPIAIIGASCRVPGANSPREFWDLLQAGKDTCSKIPSHLYDYKEYAQVEGDPTAKSKRNRMVSNTGNFLDREVLTGFDAGFFGISDEAALHMDPQQRLALTCTYEALELAGWSGSDVTDAKTAVLFGVTCDDYKENLMHNIGPNYVAGTARQMVSQRIAAAFGFGGPALTLDTVCSSSLVALDLAVGKLQDGSIDVAVVGGANLITQPQVSIGLDKAHFLSKTGQCKTLDEGADGYSRADAVNVVVIKRIDDALRDKNKIYATILATGTNHSGEAHSITHPHSPAQIALISRLLRQSGVPPNAIDVVEAHGTGTQAGDLNEVQAIRSVFIEGAGAPRLKEKALIFTSSKANVGHSEAASGLTAIIKTILMLSHRQVPRHIGIRSKLNPTLHKFFQDGQITFAKDGPVELPGNADLIACVNNFGASGGNSSVLMKSYTAPQKAVAATVASTEQSRDEKWPFFISARSPASLQANRKAFLEYISSLTEEGEVSIKDLSYTSTARRLINPVLDIHFVSTLSDLSHAILSSMDRAPVLERPPSPPFSITQIRIKGKNQAHMQAMLFLASRSSSFRRKFRATQVALFEHGRTVFDLTQTSLSEPRNQVEVLFVFSYIFASLLVDWGFPAGEHSGTKHCPSTTILSLALEAAAGIISMEEAIIGLEFVQVDETVASSELAIDLDKTSAREALFELLLLAQAQVPDLRIHWKQVHDQLNPEAKLVKLPNYRWDFKDYYIDFQDTCLVTESWSDNPIRAPLEGNKEAREDGSDEAALYLDPRTRLQLVPVDKQGTLAFRIEAASEEALTEYTIICNSQKHLDVSLLLIRACSVAFGRQVVSLEVKQGARVTSKTLPTMLLMHSKGQAHATFVTEDSHEEIVKLELDSEEQNTLPAEQQAANHLVDLHVRRWRQPKARYLSKVHAPLVYRTLRQKWGGTPEFFESIQVSNDGSVALAQLKRGALAETDRAAELASLLKATQQCLLFLCYHGSRNASSLLVLHSFRLSKVSSESGRLPEALELYVSCTGESRGQAHLYDAARNSAVLVLQDIKLETVSSRSTSVAAREPPIPSLANTSAIAAEPSLLHQGRDGAQTQLAPIAAPATEGSNEAMLDKVAAIIAGEVGLHAAELVSQDLCFSDIGIDSLMSLTVLSSLREVLSGVDLPSSLFIDYDRWSELKPYLHVLLGDENDGAAPQDSTASSNASTDSHGLDLSPFSSASSSPPSPPPSHSGAGVPLGKKDMFSESSENQEKVQSWPFIEDAAAKAVVISGTSGSALPLFLIPDGSGSPAVFQHVKGLDRLVYGLNSPFLLPRWKDDWEGGVLQIADYYVRQLRAKQPSGPYLIGGWSFGGVTASQVARNLVAAGERVAGVILLDAPCPQAMPALPETIIDWAMQSDALSGLGIKRFSEGMSNHFRTAIRALDKYHPPRCDWSPSAPVQVLLVTPTAGVEADPRQVPNSNSCVEWMFSKREGLGCCGWDELFGSHANVQVAEVGGNHFTMMVPPFIEEWLEAVNRWIKQEVVPSLTA